MKQLIKCCGVCLVYLLWVPVITAQPNITRVEYYIDNDPGYGKATPINFTAASNLSNLALNINPATLSAGVHVLGIRAKDASNAWSHDNKMLFAKPYPSDTAKAGIVPNITGVEYYLDKDPGYGNATTVNLTVGTNLSNLTININPASITSGVHLLGIRAKDANGAWCQDNRWLFAKPYAAETKAAAVPNVKQVEYYIDTDPGYGKGIPIAIATVSNLANVSLAVNISGLPTGEHKLFIHSKDFKNAWSLDNVFDFTVGAAVTSPSIVINSLVRKILCQKDSVNVSYHLNGTFNIGNAFKVELSDSSGSFSAPLTIGSYTGIINSIIKCRIPAALQAGTKYKIRVSSTDPVVTGLVSKDFIKISNLPVPVITPSGTLVITEGDSVKLSTTFSYAKYLWSTKATSATIQVKKYNAYTVMVTDSNGCSATSAPVQVNVTPVITASGPVTNLCPGATVTLTSSVANSYKWNTADTAQSIVVSTPGSYYVVANGGGIGDTSAAVKVTYKSCSKPFSLPATNITATTAILNWGKVTCAKRYQLRFRLSGTTTWSANIIGHTNTYTLGGLSDSTKYQWQVRTVCLDSLVVVSSYSSIDSFMTSAGVGIAARAFPAPFTSGFTATLYPNPATQNATLQVTGSKTKATVSITDIAGRILWQKDKINRNTNLPVEGFSAGTYLIVIKHDNRQEILKLVKN